MSRFYTLLHLCTRGSSSCPMVVVAVLSASLSAGVASAGGHDRASAASTSVVKGRKRLSLPLYDPLGFGDIHIQLENLYSPLDEHSLGPLTEPSAIPPLLDPEQPLLVRP